MEYRYFPNNPITRKFAIVQKNGPNSLSVGLPKIITTDLGIQKGTYVMIYQSADRIIIEKAICGGEQ